MGLRFEAPSFGPRLNCISRKSGAAEGVIATNIDDILGLGDPDVQKKTRRFLEKRFGKLEVQERASVHEGPQLAQETGLPVAMTQDDFTTT